MNKGSESLEAQLRLVLPKAKPRPRRNGVKEVAQKYKHYYQYATLHCAPPCALCATSNSQRLALRDGLPWPGIASSGRTPSPRSCSWSGWCSSWRTAGSSRSGRSRRCWTVRAPHPILPKGPLSHFAGKVPGEVEAEGAQSSFAIDIPDFLYGLAMIPNELVPPTTMFRFHISL